LVVFGELPVLQQFVPMLRGPFQHERPGTARQFTLSNTQGFNFDDGSILPIICVKVRWWELRRSTENGRLEIDNNFETSR